MCLLVIFAAGPVRHMSVPAGPRAGEITDNHGQRPQNVLTCPNTQVRRFPDGKAGTQAITYARGSPAATSPAAHAGNDERAGTLVSGGR